MASQRVRFEVLARDGFRCQYCGAASTDEGVRLEVDHIYPRGKGGADDKSNLITACSRCNRGKSALILERLPEGVPTPQPVLVVESVPVEPPAPPRLGKVRRPKWAEDLFTDDQLSIIANVQNRGRPAA